MKRTEPVSDHTVESLIDALTKLPPDAQVRIRTSLTVSPDGGLARSVTARWDGTPTAARTWEGGPATA